MKYDFFRNVNVAKSDVTTNLADLLYSEVRVLCAVMTDSMKLNETGHIIMDTWGKRCNKIIFFAEDHPGFETFVLKRIKLI